MLRRNLLKSTYNIAKQQDFSSTLLQLLAAIDLPNQRILHHPPQLRPLRPRLASSSPLDLLHNLIDHLIKLLPGLARHSQRLPVQALLTFRFVQLRFRRAFLHLPL